VLLTLIAGAFFSCKKKGDDVSLNGQLSGKEPNIEVSDTFQLVTRTIQEDTLSTDSLSHYLLGRVNDPIFGESQAKIFCQLRMDQVLVNPINSGGSTLDSVVLTLTYPKTDYHYGDDQSPLSFDVFELTEDMDIGVDYLSDDEFAYDNTPIGSYDAVPNYTDSIYNVRFKNDSIDLGPSIRIKLSSAFANKLFNASTNDLSSQDGFLQFVKGLAFVPKDVSPAPGSGNIFGFDVFNHFSNVTLYYDDTAEVTFVIENESEVVANYQHLSEPIEILNQKNSSSGNFDTTYVQPMSGAKTFIELPNIYDLQKDGPVTINRATVKIKVLDGSIESNFGAPDDLVLAQPNPTDGTSFAILDFFQGYGGKYNVDDNSYEFRITRHLQDLLFRKQQYGEDNNLGLFLLARSDNPIKPARIVLDTRKDVGITLEVIYTKL
jgi:hypothetical protein